MGAHSCAKKVFHSNNPEKHTNVDYNSLRKAYLLLDALHGPKEKDFDILEQLAKTGLAHQIVLTKLDRASATIWNELSATLRNNPVRGTSFKSNTRELPGSKPAKSLEKLQMGVWAPLRGALGLGCDETILGVSSEEGWGIIGLCCSILQACGALRREGVEDMKYLEAIQSTPVIRKEHSVFSKPVIEDEEGGTDGNDPRSRHPREAAFPFEDNNPMRGEVFRGEKMLRKKVYRW